MHLAVCKLLETEKHQHEELKMTWQMANDQFLESQRLMMMDMRRMESVLSAEQQRQILGNRICILFTSGQCYGDLEFQNKVPMGPVHKHSGM